MTYCSTTRPCLRIAFLRNLSPAFFVPRLRDEALQHLTFVVDGSPEVVPLAVDLYEKPRRGAIASGWISCPPDAPLPDLGGEHRPKPVPPKPNRLVTDLDSTLVQQILNVPKRQRGTGVYIMTAKRMISDDVLKYLKGSRLVIWER